MKNELAHLHETFSRYVRLPLNVEESEEEEANWGVKGVYIDVWDREGSGISRRVSRKEKGDGD